MREFCQSPDCDGLIDFCSSSDGEIGACHKCGRQYELRAIYEVVPFTDEPTLKLVDDEEKEDRRV